MHGVEELLGEADYKLLSDMLQLRRYEKDFMLRLDNKYVGRWQDNSSHFMADVRESELDATKQQQIIATASAF